MTKQPNFVLFVSLLLLQVVPISSNDGPQCIDHRNVELLLHLDNGTHFFLHGRQKILDFLVNHTFHAGLSESEIPKSLGFHMEIGFGIKETNHSLDSVANAKLIKLFLDQKF